MHDLDPRSNTVPGRVSKNTSLKHSLLKISNSHDTLLTRSLIEKFRVLGWVHEVLNALLQSLIAVQQYFRWHGVSTNLLRKEL